MNLNVIENYIINLFETKDNKDFHKESGVTVRAKEEIQRIGYCTNLNLDTVEEAKKNNIDLLITHHDAWDFVYGLKEACTNKLLEYGISHYFNHLPLDDCDFGTNNTLLDRLGLKIIEKSHEEDGFYCGRIAEFDEELSLETLVEKLESILEEPVSFWKFKDRKVKRVGLVCGGGGLTPDLKEAYEKGCDVYITGEKILYTLEYAKYIGMNLIIGSHSFTELGGMESLALKIKEGFGDIEIIKIREDHLEIK